MRWLSGMLALLALLLGVGHAAAMAAAPRLEPVTAAATPADPPCHADADAKLQAASKADSPAGTSSPQKAPGCCPDGCAGGCLLLAALGQVPQVAEPRVAHAPLAAGRAAATPDNRPEGLKRPPRPAA
jgi:hypothetical protein